MVLFPEVWRTDVCRNQRPTSEMLLKSYCWTDGWNGFVLGGLSKSTTHFRNASHIAEQTDDMVLFLEVYRGQRPTSEMLLKSYCWTDEWDGFVFGGLLKSMTHLWNATKAILLNRRTRWFVSGGLSKSTTVHTDITHAGLGGGGGQGSCLHLWWTSLLLSLFLRRLDEVSATRDSLLWGVVYEIVGVTCWDNPVADSINGQLQYIRCLKVPVQFQSVSHFDGLCMPQ